MVFHDVFQEIIRNGISEGISAGLMPKHKTYAKVVDSVSLRALCGHGAPDPALAHFQITV